MDKKEKQRIIDEYQKPHDTKELFPPDEPDVNDLAEQIGEDIWDII